MRDELINRDSFQSFLHKTQHSVNYVVDKKHAPDYQAIFNNYSPKWRLIVVDIYRAAAAFADTDESHVVFSSAARR